MASIKVTTETRIAKNQPLYQYAQQYRAFYAEMQRYAWQRLSKPDYRQQYPKDLDLTQEIMKTFGVLKRTASAVVRDTSGRLNALKALKKTEVKELKTSIKANKKNLKTIEKRLAKVKPLVANNRASKKQLEQYRKDTNKRYWLKNKLNKQEQQLKAMQEAIKAGDYGMCYGTKKKFQSQKRLEANGYKSHEGWANDFRESRDKNIFYLGSHDETQGNQLFQLYNSDASGNFIAKVRRENRFCSEEAGKYLNDKVCFSYLADELARALVEDKPVSYRLVFRGKKLYLQAMFTIDYDDEKTTRFYGVYALDFNDGFIAAVETDEHGNLVDKEHYDVVNEGSSGQRENSMRTAISQIARHAAKIGKSIAAEDLDFMDKKAMTLKGTHKDYNRMLHSLAYSFYLECLERACAREKVEFFLVDPAYTSQIGRQKFADSRKLNIHDAAALVIGRRAQGFDDRLIVE